MDPSLRHFLSTLQAKVEGDAIRRVPLPRSSDVAHLPVHVWGVYAETIPTKVGGFYLTCHVSLNRQNAPPVSTLAEARWAFHTKTTGKLVSTFKRGHCHIQFPNRSVGLGPYKHEK